MGDKIPSVRTLKSGEKVTHYPGGEQVHLPTTAVADKLEAIEPELASEAEAKIDRLLARVEEKRASQASGRRVPSDKSPI